MSGELEGQVAIVTGAGRGIGEGIALALARAGAAVTAVSRTASQVESVVAVIEKESGRALAIAADVSELDAFDWVVSRTEAAFGPVTLLVNNAAVIEPLGKSWEVDLEEWQAHWDVNVLGPLLGARAVLPGMTARGRGRIINVSSSIILSQQRYASAYGVSKVGVTRLSESLALETEGTGVTVFSLDPGRVHTDMPDAIARWQAQQDWLPPEPPAPPPNFLPAAAPAAVCVFIATGAADALAGHFFGVHDDIPELVGRAKQIDEERLYQLGMNRL